MSKAIITVVERHRELSQGMYLSGRKPCKHPGYFPDHRTDYFNMMMIVM